MSHWDELHHSPPAVSVIMPTYNARQYVADAIESVVAQTRQDWELLIVDDCSSDGTPDDIERLTDQDSRIRLTRMASNQGPAAARNIGLDLARGRYIAFLDSDDEWMPDKLEVQLMFMEARGAAFTHTSYERVTDEGALLGVVTAPRSADYRRMLKSNVVACSTVILDRHLLATVHMPEFRKGQDYATWLELTRGGTPVMGIAEVLARYRVRRGSVSSNKFQSSAWVWRIYRQGQSLPLHSALAYFSQYVARNSARRAKEAIRHERTR